MRPASTSRTSSCRGEARGCRDRRRRAEGLVPLALALGLLACGDDSPAADGSDASTSMGSSGAPTASDDSSGSGGSADDTGPSAPPECEGSQIACGNLCADLDTDPSNCGQCGRSCVIPQASATCMAGECVLSECEPGWSDCDGDPVSGCETPIDCQEGAACETSCGSTGSVDCSDVCAGGAEPVCQSPAETCNVIDDDCDGVCDQGPLPGCRVGVHRSISASMGHFYTADLAEATSGDLTLEVENFFYLYAPGVEGLQPLFRCIKGNGNRWLTTSTDCEGTAAPELTVGFISMDDRCGSAPLYRLRNPGPDFHFYTTSAGERDNAVNNLGFEDQGIAGYIWAEP